MSRFFTAPWSAIVCITLSACTVPPEGETAEQDFGFLTADAPRDAAPGTCWGKITRPAIIETVTEQAEVEPVELAVDGSVQTRAVYRTETRQEIVQERQDTWFETPCPDVQTTEFIASLQRALAARGFYSGAATGETDAPTRAAIRQFQKPRGLDSAIVSLDTARALGLVQIVRDE